MKRHLFIAVSVVSMALGGCASIGQSEFSCKGYSEAGYKCKSAREVYDLTSDRNYDTGPEERRDNQSAHEHGEDIRIAKIRRDGDEVDAVVQEEHFKPSRIQMAPLIEGPTPIRSQAKVMRIWVASYEDQEGSLHSPSIVYNEIEARKWRFGKQATGSSGAIRPVRPMHEARQAQLKNEIED